MEHHANLSRAALSSRTSFGGLIGGSEAMQRLYQLIGRASQSTSSVLLVGESGTGKELVARCIHQSGPRRDKPFAPVDCAALAPTLIESELFGYMRGAFTGADHTTRGLFQTANEGTIFLDEIGELSVYLQAKFLRALQEKEIRLLGSTEAIPINVRVIAATNRDLGEAVRAATFRLDLYFRLNVLQIKLPPLRERKEDIPLLVGSFLERFHDPSGPVPTISETALRALMDYDWPGNVRELENAIQRALALSTKAVLQAGDVFPALQGPGEGRPAGCNELMPIKEIERRAIFRVLEETGGDKLAAACLLGIGKTTLYRKLNEYARNRAIPKAADIRRNFRMGLFLICMNPQCRHLIETEKGKDKVDLSAAQRDCPKCGRFLSRFCPFCSQPLVVIRRDNLLHCSHCRSMLRKEAGRGAPARETA